MKGDISPPSDKEGEAQRLLTAAIRAQPEGAQLIIMALVDLNPDLDSPRGRQEHVLVLAAGAIEHGLVCLTKQFL